MEQLYEVQEQRNLLIPLGDGASLAADLYLPVAAGPCPVLISYYPYHKDDLIGSFCEHPRRYFTQRGYANLLVDFRGLGGSRCGVGGDGCARKSRWRCYCRVGGQAVMV